LDSSPFLSRVILKVASRCNLNCSYCYVYNKGDSTWKQRPAIMSDEVFDATLDRIRRHCELTGQDRLHISFHGGEPCLIGPKQFDSWCTKAREFLRDIAEVDFSIQTNGTLLDEAWAAVFLEHQVVVGISMDGPREIHDALRVDHAGRGSYEQVKRGLKVLQAAEVPYTILSVIQLGADPLAIHRHFLALGAARISYLLPDFTHDTIAPVRQQYGATPAADFLIPVFDDWWFNGTLDVIVEDLWNVGRIILGGRSAIETFGNEPPLYVFVEADGEIEGLDCLRTCKEGIAKINLNVLRDDFCKIQETDSMHSIAIFQGMPLPQGCRGCPEQDTCAGGYLPHRYSSERGFDNPSVWCADLLKLFAHLRSRLGVTVEQTYAGRQALQAGDAAGAASLAAN
jgi:uncharacterized protein